MAGMTVVADVDRCSELTIGVDDVDAPRGPGDLGQSVGPLDRIRKQLRVRR